MILFVIFHEFLLLMVYSLICKIHYHDFDVFISTNFECAELIFLLALLTHKITIFFFLMSFLDTMIVALVYKMQ
jgi:hypothetical protein